MVPEKYSWQVDFHARQPLHSLRPSAMRFLPKSPVQGWQHSLIAMATQVGYSCLVPLIVALLHWSAQLVELRQALNDPLAV